MLYKQPLEAQSYGEVKWHKKLNIHYIYLQKIGYCVIMLKNVIYVQ